jgi:hypothetical protein
MFKAGVPTERIMKILGHKDLKTTIEYIWLNIDDMSDDLKIYHQFLQNPIEPKTVHFEPSQIESGQSGISVHET